METELILEFITEAKEHMYTIEEDLLSLESRKEKPDPDKINKIYRAIHSIKGGAGFLGLSNIGALSHSMESLLSMIRGGEIKPEKKIIDPLLQGVDQLMALFDDWENSENVDIQPLRDRLDSLLAKEVSSEIQAELETKKSLIGMGSEGFDFEVDIYTLKQVPGPNNYYVLKYDLDNLNKKKGQTLLKLLDYLCEAGEVLDSHLHEPKLNLHSGQQSGELICDVLYTTILDKDMVEAYTELPSEGVLQIPKEELMALMENKKNGHQQEDAARKQNDMVDKDRFHPVDAGQDSNISTMESPTTRKKMKTVMETIRVNVPLLDQLMTLAGELVLVRNQQLQSLDKTDPKSRSMVKRLDLVTSELQEQIMRTRMQQVGNVFGKLPRIVRDLSQKLGRQIDLHITGNEVEMDKTILEALSDPLTHLVRNCCDHGIETSEEREKAGKSGKGNIRIRAYHEGGQINIEIVDDGKGIDSSKIKAKAVEKGLKTQEEVERMPKKELVSLILLPGFSTAEQVSDVSGRGVGMDVVKTGIEKLGGVLDINSEFGKGTTIHLRLPLTLAIIPCLIVEVGEGRFAIPQVNLEELVCLYDEDVKTKVERAGEYELYRLRDHLLPLVRMGEILASDKPLTKEDRAVIAEKNSVQRGSNGNEYAAEEGDGAKEKGEVKSVKSMNFAVLKVGMDQYGLIVDKILGTEEIVVKPMHPMVKDLTCYSGSTVMGDGRVALILDAQGISGYAGINFSHGDKALVENQEKAGSVGDEKQTVLLFKNGAMEQFAVALPLIRRIEKIKKSCIEKIGDKEFITVDGVSTLILRLDRILKVSPCEEREEMFLLLPKHIQRPFGILMSKVVDIETGEIRLNTESYMDTGIMGTSILRDKMTMFLDIYSLIEKAEPDWFSDRRDEFPVPDSHSRLLLVEDIPFFRQLLKGYLETDGYEVTTAENGRIALERIKDNPVDLIISDIEMPVMNGFDFIKSLRASEPQHHIPALALSALDSDKNIHKAMECGFNDYEVKIDRERLLSKVAEMLKGN